MNIVAKFASFFELPIPKESLGFFRISIAAFALLQVMVLWPDWMTFYGPHGLLPWEISSLLSVSNTPSVSMVAEAFRLIGILSETTVYILTVLYVLSLTGLMVGFCTRTMGVIAWIMHMTLNTTGHFLAYGVDTFMHIALFYCALLPLNVCWSVDNILKPRTVQPYLITFSIRLIQLHLCIVYLATGLEKAMGDQWWTGEAIWIALQQDQFNHFNTTWLASVPLLAKLLSMGTLLIEIFYPLGMFLNPTKKFFFLAIVSMHIFIAVFLGLHLFGFLMTILNFSLFGEHVFPGLFSTNHRRRKIPVPREV
jgi:hypothetical protein